MGVFPRELFGSRGTMSSNHRSEQPGPNRVASSPKETIYINNLSEKLQLEELKKALYTLFAQYGTVLEIVACKQFSLRGQAWIVFDSITEASTAMQKLNDFVFYEKPMRIQYAREKSDVILEREGEYVDKQERKVHKRKQRDQETEERARKRQMVAQTEDNPPNKLLLLQNIPPLDAKVVHDMLTSLFNQFAGLKEVRMAPGRGAAFAEFENEIQAGRAREGLQSFQVAPDTPLAIFFAK